MRRAYGTSAVSKNKLLFVEFFYGFIAISMQIFCIWKIHFQPGP